jgi:NitT/TauT family transport system substrate-binding protein
VLVVREEVTKQNAEWVQQLVDGIARSGKWLDEGADHRMDAAENISQQYYNQKPELLRFVLSKPPDRVTYSNLLLARKEFEEIEQLARDAGILEGPIGFDDYADTSFSTKTAQALAYEWKGTQ